MEEVYKCLEKLYTKQKVSIQTSNDKISCKFKMISPLGDEEEIIIPLEKKSMKESEINYRVCNEVNELKKRVISLEKENCEFKNIIQNLESRLQKLEKDTIFEEEFDSKIISEKKNIKFVIDKLQEIFPGKKLKFNLLYRATRDGDQISTFHSKCDYKKQVLVLYHTIKRVKFGGYTDIGFDCSNSWKKDLKSFIFSLDKKKIYNSIGKDHIGCYDVIGPSFGCSGVAIYLYDNIPILSSRDNRHNTNKNIFSFEGLNDYEINNGEQYFNLQELEVFQISPY